MAPTTNISNNSQRIAKNTIFLFLRMIIVLAVGLFTSRVVLSTLGVVDFGIYNVVGGIVILLSFLQQALTNSTSRYITYSLGQEDKKYSEDVFSTAITIHLFLCLIATIFLETIGLYFLNNTLSIPSDRIFAANVTYQLSIVGFCIGAIKTPFSADIIAHERMSLFAYASILETILKLLIVYLLLILSADKLILYATFICLVNLLLLILYYVYCRNKFEECKWHKKLNKELCLSMFKYSGWSIVVNGTDVCVNQSIVYFFNIFLGVISNAALGIATQVNAYVNQFLNSFTQAYNPQIIKSYAAGDHIYFLKLLFSSSKISYFLMFLMSMPLIFNVDLILSLWLKEVPADTATFVIMMLLFSLVDAYSAPLWTAVYATGNIRNHQILMAGIKIVNIPLAYMFLLIGMPGWLALLTKAALNVVCSIVRPIYVKRLYGLPLVEYFKKVFSVVYLVSLISLPLPIVSCYMADGAYSRFFYSCISFFVIALPAIWFVGLDNSEKSLVQSLVLSKFHKK